ncbi:MAG: GGDEF domain-containing protein [Thiobacillaceae bacterium]
MEEWSLGPASEGKERRGGSARVNWSGPQPEGIWLPEQKDVLTQFLTRMLFFALGVMFFTASVDIKPVLVSVNVILLVYGVYFIFICLMLWQALKSLSLIQIRFAMLIDMFMVTLSVIHDPYSVPPSALAFLMVLLGNGMRYGMRVFTEAMAVAFLGMALSYGLRYRLAGFEVSAADVFFGVFWLVIALYAYVLVGRINLQYRMLDYRSRRDNLTGLLNRHGISDKVDELMRTHNKGSIAILFADLNAFKQINDQFGHAAGDRVLVDFGQIFKDSAETDAVGRWGGDEFVAAFLGGINDVRIVIDRVQRRMKIWSQANGLPVSVSLGFSFAPRDGHDLVTLLSVADIALYRQKAAPIDSGTIASLGEAS